MIGLGTVGTEVARGLLAPAHPWGPRDNVRPELARIAVAHPEKPRDIELPEGILCNDPDSMATDPSVDILVELTGEVEDGRRWCTSALRAGKHVVTANKFLLAIHLDELEAAAREGGAVLRFEASVGGGLPLLHCMAGGFSGHGVYAFEAVLNGTSQYILSRMDRKRLRVEFEQALAEAQQMGFAESDPSDDVSGRDAACKVVLLARTGLGIPLCLEDVSTRPLDLATPEDLLLARDLGHRLRPLAVGRRIGERGSWTFWVGPALVPESHPLASLEAQENGLVLHSAAGTYSMRGPGAGGGPTAGAVLSDICQTVEELSRGDAPPASTRERGLSDVSLIPPADCKVAHYIRMAQADLRTAPELLNRAQLQFQGSIETDDTQALMVGAVTPVRLEQALTSQNLQWQAIFPVIE